MYKKLGKKCHNEVIKWRKDVLFENVWLKKSRLEIALLFLVRMKMSSTVSYDIRLQPTTNDGLSFWIIVYKLQ